MSKQLLFALLLGFMALMSCNSQGNSNTEEADADDMAQFADDKDFQAAHETPEATTTPAEGMMITFPTPDGKTGSAYALTSESTSGKFLFVVHEWWGLNDHIKQEAVRLFKELGDVNVLALDLYDGNVATSQEQATQFMQAVSEDRANAIIKGALAYAGPDAKIGTIGWCFGGGWSLKASIMAAGQGAGCVMYYGMPVQDAKALAPLKADILGLFAKQDGFITPEVVNKFEALAKATGKNIEVHEYDAVHAFANPSNPKYDKEKADEANALALAFLQKHL